MYYKVIIYDEPERKVEVVEVTEEEARYQIGPCYGFVYASGESGHFAVGATKDDAKLILEKSCIDKIYQADQTIKEQEKIIKLIKDV